MVRYIEKHELRDGRILLYIDGDKKKPIWNCRFRLPGRTGYILKSSGTTNLAEATKFAEDQYDDMRFKLRNNMPIKDKLFEEVFDLWIETGIENLSIHRQKLHNSIGKRYFRPFFGKTDIVRINEQKIEEYWDWRLSYWRSGPGAAHRPSNAVDTPAQKTLDIEKGMLGQILKWAKRRGHLTALPLLHAPRLKNKRSKEERRRPGFSEDEIAKLIQHMETWEAETPNAYHRYYRSLMKHAIMLVYYSGMRPNELFQLKWSDIEYHGNETIAFHIAPTTKTGERVCVPMPEVLTHLISIQDITNEKWDSTNLVLKNLDGNPLKWTYKPLSDLLKNAGLLIDTFGRKRTFYSFRHAYATHRLIAGTPINKLAKNLGTSVSYIEQHYDHTTNLMNAESLTTGSNAPPAEETWMNSLKDALSEPIPDEAD